MVLVDCAGPVLVEQSLGKKWERKKQSASDEWWRVKASVVRDQEYGIDVRGGGVAPHDRTHTHSCTPHCTHTHTHPHTHTHEHTHTTTTTHTHTQREFWSPLGERKTETDKHHLGGAAGAARHPQHNGVSGRVHTHTYTHTEREVFGLHRPQKSYLWALKIHG